MGIAFEVGWLACSPIWPNTLCEHQGAMPCVSWKYPSWVMINGFTLQKV